MGFYTTTVLRTSQAVRATLPPFPTGLCLAILVRMDKEGDRLLHAGHAYPELVGAWFDAEREGLLARADRLIDRAVGAEDTEALVAEALRVKHAVETIARDRWLIQSTLSRAVRARRAGLLLTTEPFQDACDTSAAAALASIDRSETAWQALAEWMDGSATALLVAGMLGELRTQVERQFPSARRVVTGGPGHASL
jgi:hypothetical protein